MTDEEIANVQIAAMNAGVRIDYSIPRPWQQKWLDVTDGLEQIQAIYDQNNIDDRHIRRSVEQFFEDCRDLADWLSQAGKKRQAEDHVYSDPDLLFANAMAQTTKHHTRDPGRNPKKEPDPISARVLTIMGSGGNGVRVEIDFVSNAFNGRKDALDLAQRCVTAWLSFFPQESLDQNG